MFHKAFGHPYEGITYAIVHTEGVLLKEKFSHCEDLALGKTRQANECS